MAIGNIIGSNLFNILGVLALPGLILPSTIDAEVLSRDYLIMAGLTVMLYLMSTLFKSDKKSIGRIEGAILLSCFGGYLWLLFEQTIHV
jgi:cation:H+ antiporter